MTKKKEYERVTLTMSLETFQKLEKYCLDLRQKTNNKQINKCSVINEALTYYLNKLSGKL